MLYSTGRSWADELLYIVWAYQTTPREATKETLFPLVYGAETRLSIEAWISMTRERSYDEEKRREENEKFMVIDFDCIEEMRELVV